MRKNAMFLSLLCLIFTNNSSAQTEIGNNIYKLTFSKVFSFDSRHKEIGIKTSDLHVGTHYQAMAKVNIYSTAFSVCGFSWDYTAPFLLGFRTIKEPPLPNYATDYQNISTGKTTRMIFNCEDLENVASMNPTTEKYDSNDILIFKKMLVSVAKQLFLEKDGGDFESFKNMSMNVDVQLERQGAWPGLIKSIRIPGVNEITDLTPFIDINSINVYPNPSSNGIFTMSFYTHTVIDISYTVKNFMLATIIEKTISNLDTGTHTFQVNPGEPLQPGMYYLNAIVGTKTLYRTLIVD